MAGKVPSHCGDGLVFYVQNVTLESVNKQVFKRKDLFLILFFSLSNIF